MNPEVDGKEVIAHLGMTASEAEALIHPEKVGPRAEKAELPPLGPETNPPPAKNFIKDLKAVGVEDDLWGGSIPLGKDEPIDTFVEKLNEAPPTEATPSGEVLFTGDPTDPLLKIVVDGWNRDGDDILIGGKVTSITTRSGLKRDSYTDQWESEAVWEPEDFKLDIVVRKVTDKIRLTDGDLEILTEVVRRLARAMDGGVRVVAAEKKAEKQAEARKNATPIGGTPIGGTPIEEPAAPAQEEL